MKALLPAALHARLTAVLDRGLPALLVDAALGLGVLCLATAAVLPWFLVPHLPPADAIAGEPVRGLQPGITWLFRALCAGGAAAAIATRWLPVAWRRHHAAIAAGLLLAVLLYPTAILHTAPGLAARAAWQWNQHDQLTGYAGDIYNSQEVRDATWQQRILVANAPLQNRVVRLPTWSPATLEWGRLLEMSEWLGLSAWFSQSLARGWSLAAVGALLLAIATAHRRALRERGFFPRFCGRAAIVAAAVGLLALLPFFISGHLLTRARSLAQGGRAPEALAFLHRAARVVPALREDGNFLLQIGLLESTLHRATPAAALYHARCLAEDGYAQQAEAAMLDGLAASGANSALQREFIKGLLSGAIEALNSGRTAPAVLVLERVLAADPCQLKANYALQIAAVRLGHFETLEHLAARLLESYRFLNTPTKRSVLATTQEHLAFVRMLHNSPGPALAHLRASRRPPR